jgi:small subunit ribosomal protein S20
MSRNKSAMKRIRQSEARREQNRNFRKRLATAIKNVRNAESREEGEQKLKTASSMLDRAAVKGMIHRNKAANQKSKLTRKVSAL